tara:strand:- start:4750 stop:5532 length:783 start_codon:yes stop_codon:yes gene_type:complete
MPKISITKKMIWSLILKINSNHIYKDSKNIININEIILDNEINIIYDKKKNIIKNKNISFSDTESLDIFKIFFPIICSSDKNQYIAHIAQSLDGFIATRSGESKYISGKKNIEHIHRLRALSDIIIVGANTYLEDKPKLTTRLVEGTNPDVYVFDPKEIIKKRDVENKITLLKTDLKPLKNALLRNMKTIIYIEGGGKTISYFLNKNMLNRIHICLCPIILGGGRASFINNKYTKLTESKSYNPYHYEMGDDVLFDIKLR